MTMTPLDWMFIVICAVIGGIVALHMGSKSTPQHRQNARSDGQYDIVVRDYEKPQQNREPRSSSLTWRDGVYDGRAYRNSERWKSLRKATWQRDGYQCRFCGSQSGLTTHHRIYPECQGQESVKDLTTFCHDCHIAAHVALDKRGGKIIGQQGFYDDPKRSGVWR